MGEEDDKKEVSSKEEENSKQDEKDKDTAAAGDDQGTKTPASAKGKTAPEKSPSKTKKPKAGKSKKDEGDQPTPAPAAEKEEQKDGLPEGCVALFLSSKSQELFECVADEQVTAENPHKLVTKEAIIQDMKTRAAVSDFTPVKQQMQDYPGEEVLLIYDAEFKYGENFYIALTEEAKELILNPPAPEAEEGEEGGEGGEGQEEEEVIYRYVPPEPKEWISLGSEVEIEEEAVVEAREKLKFTIQRVRREFGAPVNFTDRGPDDVKDGYIECVSYEDKSFNIKKMELDSSVQAIGTYTDSGTQTDWKHPCNKSTQYAPRLYEEEERKKLAESEEMLNFINQVTPRFELALQQNEIMDVFCDDWKALADEDSTFGSKSDNHLKEYQSFTDLLFSKDKTLTCIEWHPTNKGIIAVSCAERVSFDDRVDSASKILMNPSLVLLWSFLDPIHPQILLEAPDDIFSFKFNPSDPNIITGGCINGQVVMWDISKYADRLRSNNQRGKQVKKNTMSSLPGFEDENNDKTPVVRYCAVSSIEHSHKSAVSDIQWIPDHMEITRGGVIVESKIHTCSQVLTASVDGTCAIWDTRPPKGQTPTIEESKADNPLGVATTFKHLDLTWKPTLKIPISRLEGSGEYGVTRISIAEKQGDRGAVDKQQKSGEIERKESSMGGIGMGGSLRMGSAKDKKPLEGATTKFFVGTEDGEFVYADWKLEKDADTGKIQAQRPAFCKALHDRSINTLQRSPFYKDIVLVVGGWNFTIWKEGNDTAPLLQSASAPKRLTAGFWSPTRPAVFYIGTADGNVDVWDLLDRTHEPSLSQNVSASAITNIFPWDMTTKQQLLAVSDSVGTLHILEVPWTLRHCSAGELSSVTNYFDREVKRLEYIDNRKGFHDENKRKLAAEEAARKAPPSEPNTEEVENKMRVDWLDYQEDEKKFLEELGLLVEPDEPLPEV